METASPGNLREIEALRYQAGAVHRVVQLNLAGISHEDSLVHPAAGGNCLNWVLGHLVATYQHTFPLLGQEPVLAESVAKRYDRGSRPMEDPAEALELSALLSAWDQVAERFLAGLSRLTTEDLDRPAPFSPSKNPNETVRSLLTVVLFHQAYHAGQTGVLRRVAGQTGAIA